MQLGLVVGTATATRRHASLSGVKLLVVQTLLADGQSPDGEPVLAADQLGAGVGETVMITSDGKYTREMLGDETTPVRWCVIGIPNS
ncbi:MAG TPA: EutN/CcmL family microcompartment protein [Pirellulales bacterium]|nr:EutN/CcmL family microcompartment protein [Pirellulales bacterium]